VVAFVVGGSMLPANTSRAETQYELYADVGYLASNRDSEGNEWPGKSTTSELDQLNLHLIMANLRKEADTGSRWGFEIGLQAGEDADNLVPSAPPESNRPVKYADELRHLYRANVSYLFGEDGGLKLTGGLINSFIGYESYVAIQNANYTRSYFADAAPYFLVGAEAMWDVSESTDLGFYLITGFNYLADANDAPSLGFAGNFQLTDSTKFVQNFYYGPDQADTSLEFWRFLSNSILKWEGSKLSIAASLDIGSEKQAEEAGTPRADWLGGAVWIDWAVTEKMNLALRPEFQRDTGGIITGSEQSTRGITGTLKYEWLPHGNRIVTVLEARYDHSRGDEGGFPEDDGNIPSDQTMIIASFMWQFQ